MERCDLPTLSGRLPQCSNWHCLVARKDDSAGSSILLQSANLPIRTAPLVLRKLAAGRKNLLEFVIAGGENDVCLVIINDWSL